LTAEIFKIYDKQKNLFESCATVCPDIKCLKKYFSGFCSKQYGLSGSGPTMFCGVDDFTQAEEIAYGLEKFNGDIFIVRPESAGVKII
jgi:4-diphosphocytidyl-2C-methyl-D-erythritol kinase